MCTRVTGTENIVVWYCNSSQTPFLMTNTKLTNPPGNKTISLERFTIFSPPDFNF